MPTIVKKTIRHTTKDGMHLVQEVFTSTTSYKPFIRPKQSNEEVKPSPDWTCIGQCGREFNGLVGGIRSRILKGYRIKMGKKIVLSDYPDPTTDKQFPEYKNGRLCTECAKQFSITNKAPKLGEVQFLKDIQQVVHKQTPVTDQDIEAEDQDQERLDAQAKQDKLGHLEALGGRIKLPLGTGKHTRTNENIVTVCSMCEEHNGDHIPRCTACNAATCKEEQKVHIKAFRAFIKNPGGRNTGGRKLFDPEVNFHNQKKG